jgi:hypothetical protein
MPFYSLYKNLIISQGRADVNMRLNITQIVLQFILILATYQQGILVVVYAYSALNILWLLAWQVYAHRMVSVRLLDVLKDTLPFALISLAVMAVVCVVTLPLSNIYLLLIVRVLLAGLLYVGIMKLLRVKIMDECISFLLKKKH